MAITNGDHCVHTNIGWTNMSFRTSSGKTECDWRDKSLRAIGHYVLKRESSIGALAGVYAPCSIRTILHTYTIIHIAKVCMLARTMRYANYWTEAVMHHHYEVRSRWARWASNRERTLYIKIRTMFNILVDRLPPIHTHLSDMSNMCWCIWWWWWCWWWSIEMWHTNMTWS